jgi:hypothetical protein
MVDQKCKNYISGKKSLPDVALSVRSNHDFHISGGQVSFSDRILLRGHDLGKILEAKSLRFFITTYLPLSPENVIDRSYPRV